MQVFLRFPLCCFLLWTGAAAFAQLPSISASSQEIPALARSLDLGESFQLSGLSLGNQETVRSLILQRFDVFTPGAKVVVQTENGPQEMAPPKTLFFSGFVEGSPNSYVYLSLREDNSIRGVIGELGEYYLLAAGESAGVMVPGLQNRQVMSDELVDEVASFNCGADELVNIGQQALAPSNKRSVRPKPTAFPNRGKVSNKYQVSIALETDNEYYNLFGNATDAANYLADLIAFTSGLYELEVDTSVVISHISLWAPGSTDPWSGNSSACLLYQLGKYWNDNNSGIARSIAHFVSGRNSNSGVAWLGVLCNNQFNVNTLNSGCGLSPTFSNYGGDYGFSGGIDGNFNINSPASIWDIIVIVHEIGHNFNSPHTHCYAGLNGNANHIDQCFGSEDDCYSGSVSLPSGCPGSSQGCGTIMSYCHLSFSGGLSNISLTLGMDHPYGIAPERVPTRMREHVVDVNGFDASCLPELYPSILENWPDPATVLDILNVLF